MTGLKAVAALLMVAALAAGDWVVNPKVPGPDQPPLGESIFDKLVPGPLPFPFAKLLEKLAPTPLKVLVPLGRSLQRFTAAPFFFRFPRAIAVYPQKQLFLAYQEKGALIEVISYNEQAGRFEFELVKDYRQGAKPRVELARRSVCTACHQNQAPIFSRQLWDETNANVTVARLLAAEKKDFYGFPVPQTADTPQAIDLAIHRANELSTYRLLWNRAGQQMRTSWMNPMQRCRLQNVCGFEDVAPALAAKWREWFPEGLLIPNPEIPDRNPTAILSREGPSMPGETLEFLALRQMTIGKQFEPSIRREPLATWIGTQDNAVRVLAGMAKQ